MTKQELLELAKEIFTNDTFCSDYIPEYRRAELIPVLFLNYRSTQWKDELGMLVQSRAQASFFLYLGYPVFGVGNLIPPAEADVVRRHLARLRAERIEAAQPRVKTPMILHGRSVRRLTQDTSVGEKIS